MKPTRTLAYILATVAIAIAGIVALAYKSTQSDQDAASHGANRSATGNVQPATGSGPADGTALSMAPPEPGTHAIVSASAADATKSGSADAVVSPPGSIDPSAFLPADRATVWNPGMMGVGGIPVRSKVCSTLAPHGGGGMTRPKSRTPSTPAQLARVCSSHPAPSSSTAAIS